LVAAAILGNSSGRLLSANFFVAVFLSSPVISSELLDGITTVFSDNMPREFSREKRAHSDSTTTSKRKYHEGSEDSQPAKKKKVHPPKHEHNYPSVNELKKRIRDVKRLLNRVDLPADARIVQERALAGYEKDLEDELARRHRSQMIKKYHFVRFLGTRTPTTVR
jgi:hypothetical protein